MTSLKPVAMEQVRRPEPIWGGVCGWSLQWGRGADNLVGSGALPAEAGSFLAFARSKDRQICPFFLLIFGTRQIDRQLEHPGPG